MDQRCERHERRERLFTFIDNICKEYNIDESHDVRHAHDCVHFATQLMDFRFSEDERNLITYAAALHDCVDKKYVVVADGVRKIRDFLRSEGWPEERIDVLINIITTMSYSFLQSLKTSTGNVFPDHGPWQRAYHTVREADLLCSYRVERCYHYQKRISPDILEHDCWKRVEEFFQTRVFKYVLNRWILSNAAQALVPALIREACRKLDRRSIV